METTSLPTTKIDYITVKVDGGALNLAASQWEELVRINFKEFKGNPEKAGTLMAEFCQGFKETFAFHARGRYKKQAIPSLVFVTSATANESSFALHHPIGSPDVLGVNLSVLESDSLISEGATIVGRAQDNREDIRCVESINDFWRSGGWEEAHHALFRGGGSQSEAPEQHLPTFAYDATPVEFKALRWSVRMAKKLHAQDPARFPWYTTRVLEARFHRAKQYKKTNQQLPPLTLDSLGIVVG